MGKYIKNAIIKSTFLGIKDHGIMTFTLTLDYGLSSQGAGNYCIENAAGMACIRRLLEVVGVDSWDQLKGRHVRADNSFDRVYAIGHIIKDEWLNFETFFKEYNNKNVEKLKLVTCPNCDLKVTPIPLNSMCPECNYDKL